MSTRHRLDLRQDQAAHAARLLARRSARPGGRAHPGIVLALWDGVGCALELSGFRNDVAGRIAQYQQECSLEIGAAHAIEGLQRALQHRIDAGYDERAAGAARVLDAEENGMRQRAVMRHAAHDPAALGRPLAALDEQFKAGRITEADYKARRSVVIRTHCADPAAMEAEYARIDEYRRRLAATRARHQAHNKADGFAREWPKYGERIDHAALERFKREYEAFGQRAQALLDARTAPLVAWLEAPLFIAALEDYDPADVGEGLAFNELAGELLLGIDSSPAGRRRLDAWVAEARASRGNLVWRGLAMNQMAATVGVDAALAEAERHRGERTLAASLEWVGYTSGALKGLADVYLRAQETLDRTAHVAGAPDADRWAVAVGDAVFRRYRVNALGEYAAEKIVQHLFSIRAFVDPRDSERLIAAQARHAELARSQTLARLRTAHTFLAADVPQVRSVQAEALAQAWDEFRSSGGAAHTAALRDARLAAVVMLIEGLNFFKLTGDCALNGDSKSWWTLAASGMTITSALFDVAAVPAKNLFGGAHSWSYQKLKLAGGVLAAAGGAVGVVLDAEDYLVSASSGKKLLATLYLSKTVVGATGSALWTATTLTSAAPLVGRLTGSLALSGAARLVGGAAMAILGFRILVMSAGSWITVGLFGIQVFIWCISEDRLEEWLSQSAFRKGATSTNGFESAARQQEALTSALIEVGLAS